MGSDNLINEQRLIENFIDFAKQYSTSNEDEAEKNIPSSQCQKDFALYLYEKLQKTGLTDVKINEHYIVFATLPSNVDKKLPIMGLLSHYDTSAEAPGENVNPIIHEYVSGDILLKNNVKINESDLKEYRNQKIITSDGTTLLGADDKAGIAEILEAIEVLIENPNIKHPEIRIAFTPDEETGLGISKFDIEEFGTDFAYTIDGDLPFVIENESFNAFNPRIIIKGKNVHTGYAKGKMINAVKIAAEIVSKLPEDECPEKTEGREGFYHACSISGDVNEACIDMLIRDHDYSKATERLDFLTELIKKVQEKYSCEISFDKRERYHNMKQFIDKAPEVMQFAQTGIKRSGLVPETKAIRGGTDGSQLSERGLITPNLGAGGVNFHSVKEFLPVNNLKKCCENIINIAAVCGEN